MGADGMCQSSLSVGESHRRGWRWASASLQGFVILVQPQGVAGCRTSGKILEPLSTSVSSSVPRDDRVIM